MATRKKPDKYFKVIVHRGQTGVDYGSTPIFVDCGMPHVPPKAFTEGAEVILHESQIGVLKEAKIMQTVFIPRSSGVYQALNPVRAAEARNPGIKFRIDPITGVLTGKKEVRCYIVEVLEQATKKAFKAEFNLNANGDNILPDKPEPEVAAPEDMPKEDF